MFTVDVGPVSDLALVRFYCDTDYYTETVKKQFAPYYSSIDTIKKYALTLTEQTRADGTLRSGPKRLFRILVLFLLTILTPSSCISHPSSRPPIFYIFLSSSSLSYSRSLFFHLVKLENLFTVDVSLSSTMFISVTNLAP